MKKLRVAFSGSGFKFPAHVGALQALYDADIEIEEVSGTSGGSIVACLVAAGMPIANMVELTMHRDWSDMLVYNPFAIFEGGYCNGKALLNWIDKVTFGATFNDVKIPLTIMSSDASTETGFNFSKKTEPNTTIAFASRCSASIPIVYSAIKYKGALLQDGGMVNNIPADVLVKDEIPRLGIHLTSQVSPITSGRTNLLELLARDLNMILSANENAHIDDDILEGCHFAFVETGFANGLDRNMSQQIRYKLYNAGYAATKAAIDGITFA